MIYLRCITIFLLALLAAGSGRASCPPAGFDRAQLESLKARRWSLPDARRRNALALALTPCLASPDPELRDGLAYEAFAALLRNHQLSDVTLQSLTADLQARLSAPPGQGFERPFAALVLSEVARADRLSPFLTPERRAHLLDASLSWFSAIRDHRGFDDASGWRHGVAHGADLLLQLSLNPAFGRPEWMRIRDAIASQIAPRGHFYIYGEGARLAAPIVAIAQRRGFTEAEWTAWMDQVASPAPLASWADAFGSNEDLARVNDVVQFMQALYLSAKLNSSVADDVLLPGAEAAIRRLP